MTLNVSYPHDVATRLAGRGDAASIFQLVEAEASRLGSSLTSLGRLQPSGVSIICPNGPQDYFRHYVTRRYDRVSPVVARMRASLIPFMWSEVPDDRDNNPMGHHCMSEARDAG